MVESLIPKARKRPLSGAKHQQNALINRPVDIEVEEKGEGRFASLTRRRPSTAPIGRTLDEKDQEKKKKFVRLSIRDIVRKNDQVGEKLEDNLKRKTRALLESKKRQLNQLSFEAAQKKKQLADLDEVYRDLLSQGDAVGLHCEAEFKPVKAVSAKPVYSKNSKISQLEQDLEELQSQWKYQKQQAPIYKFMLNRYRQAKDQEEAKSANIQAMISQAEAQCHELQRELERNRTILESQRTKFKQVQSRARQDIKLWKREIRTCQEYISKRAKVKSMYERALEMEETIQENDAGFLTAKQAKKVKSKELAAKFQSTISRTATIRMVTSKKSEEDQYVQAFLDVGLKVQDLTPSLALKTCLAQADIRKDLITKVQEAESKLDVLNKSLASVQSELNESMFTSPQEERTANRVLQENERVLHDFEKSLSKVKERCTYLEGVFRPVKIGVDHLSQKVLGVNFLGLHSDPKKAFAKLLAQVCFLVEQYTKHHQENADQALESGDGGPTLVSSTMDGSDRAQAATSSALFQQLCVENSHSSSLLSNSPFNVRVKADPTKAFSTVDAPKGDIATEMARAKQKEERRVAVIKRKGSSLPSARSNTSAGTSSTTRAKLTRRKSKENEAQVEFEVAKLLETDSIESTTSEKCLDRTAIKTASEDVLLRAKIAKANQKKRRSKDSPSTRLFRGKRALNI